MVARNNRLTRHSSCLHGLVLVASVLLAACGGGSSGVADTSAHALASDVATDSGPVGERDRAALARGAQINRDALSAAEQHALAVERGSSPGQNLAELSPGATVPMSAYSSGAVAAKSAAVRIPAYRFFNGRSGAHFYTTSTAERDQVQATLSPPFAFEGAAFLVASGYSPGLRPVHRFYNTQTGVHFYTISEGERAHVVANLPRYRYEGVAYHASPVAGQGLVPLYRFFVPSRGFHFFTANKTERDSIIASLSAIYSYEGVGYYVLGQVPAVAQPGPAPCEPSGIGTDYQVGPGVGQLPGLANVPWESLVAGDTVRIFYRPTPYAGKFAVFAQGTAEAPVRICGVKGPSGQRPTVTGVSATTRAALAGTMGSNGSFAQPYNESRGVVFVSRKASEAWTAYPRHIQIHGLRIQGAHPNYSYVDSFGTTRNYLGFGACLWIDRGHNITIADNEITDCSQGIFSRSTDDGDFAVTKDLLIAGNTFTNNGIVGDVHMHATYLQSHRVVYEFNRYGALRAGASGNSIKDRSVGTVVRYNRIEDGARAIDLVEAEDFPTYALSRPDYRSTFVYGNQIIKDGRKGSTIHYGGDHNGSTPGANWGEPYNRKGTLYFFSNTVRLTGDGYAVLFQLSTTEERAEIWNNVFVFDDSIPYAMLRSSTDVGAAWTAGGILNFGRNWINARWGDTDPYHTVPGQIIGTANFITGTAAPVNTDTLVPLAGSAIIDQAQAPLPAASAHPVTYQLDPAHRRMIRTVQGASADLGAVEYGN